MRTSISATATLALLAGCSSGSDSSADADGDGEITQAEMVSEMESAGEMAMQPGMWEQTIEFTEIDMPGIPENMQDMMRSQMGASMTMQHCLSAEDVSRPDPDFFGGEGQENCTYEDFDMSQDSMRMRMTCDGGEGTMVHMNMNGAMHGDSFTMDIDNRVSGVPSGDMTMKGTVTGRRIGEC